MARFENGYVKLYRRVWQEDIGKNPYCLCLWIALLSMANWRETKTIWEGSQRTLPPGSVLFGIKELADHWGCSRSVIKKWLHYLHDTQRLVLETSPRGCIVTILNWGTYQLEQADPSPGRARNVSTACPQRVHSAPLIEEEKKERREEEVSEEFEQIYRLYPKRRGTQRKQSALASFRKNFRSPERRAALTAAIRAYSAECTAEKKHGTPYVMQIATFLNGPWEEYAQKATPAGQPPRLKTFEEIEAEAKGA